ncbi:MAG: patatin-like phospholipase family protein [Terricaulis sp.]
MRNSLIAAALTLLAACATEAAPAPPPLGAAPSTLRSYSDDPLLAERLVSEEWRTPEDGTFDVLALSGGGPNGAFGAGVLAGWTARGDRPVFDHVTGVSTGALIAPFAYLGADWDDALKDAYLDERTEGLMRRRALAGLFSSSVFTGEPLRNLVDSYVTQDLVDAIAAESLSGRTLIVITTDLDGQRSAAWDMGAIARLGGERARQLFRDVMVASASIPGLFPPMTIDIGAGPEMHVDGGVAAPIYAVPEAIADRPEAALGAHAPLRIFMIVNTAVAPIAGHTTPGAFSILRRSLDTSGKASMRSVLQMNAAIAQRFGASFRVISVPAADSADLTDFSPPTMARLYELGRQMALDDRWRTSAGETAPAP